MCVCVMSMYVHDDDDDDDEKVRRIMNHGEIYDVAAYQKICYAEFWLRMD